ncbi:MAG: archease [Euryarchaeota archaeon]|nr:archease [Euryarchaeota archaeon]
MPYRYLEEVAIADVAFEAWGRDLGELFEAAALATFEVMVDLEGVESKVVKEIELENEEMDRLLYDWLSELVYLKDAEAMLFSRFQVRIKGDGRYRLRAEAMGEEIDQARHRLRADVKAVTYHLFYLKKTEEGYRARVVLDI